MFWGGCCPMGRVVWRRWPRPPPPPSTSAVGRARGQLSPPTDRAAKGPHLSDRGRQGGGRDSADEVARIGLTRGGSPLSLSLSLSRLAPDLHNTDLSHDASLWRHLGMVCFVIADKETQTIRNDNKCVRVDRFCSVRGSVWNAVSPRKSD